MRYVRLVVAVLVVVSLGYCGSKTYVTFIQFGARSKEAEPRSKLRDLAKRQRAFFADAGRWATSFEELDFTVSHNRFRYALGPGEPSDAGPHVVLEAAPNFGPHPSPAVPTDSWSALDAGAFVIFATGDLDGDPGVSVWRVTSLDLPCADPHGPDEPCRVVDDLE